MGLSFSASGTSLLLTDLASFPTPNPRPERQGQVARALASLLVLHARPGGAAGGAAWAEAILRVSGGRPGRLGSKCVPAGGC